jgi:type II secretory pathway pseudopilin PulG
MKINRRNTRAEESGFSLIEVILAIGILAGVLISIGSMFALGGRQVKSGKTMTEATVLVQDIMEEFDKLSFNGLSTGLAATTSDRSKTDDSANSGSPVEPWQAEIERKLNNGSASVTILPIGPGTPNFGTAAGIRLTVSLSWTELGRQQTVSASTVRF